MDQQDDTAFDHAQSVVVLATCTALVWSDSFELAGKFFVALQASLLLAKWVVRLRAKLRNKPETTWVRERFG